MRKNYGDGDGNGGGAVLVYGYMGYGCIIVYCMLTAHAALTHTLYNKLASASRLHGHPHRVRAGTIQEQRET